MAGVFDLPHESRPMLPIEDDDDDEDETLSERLIGLTEMFPESVRHAAGSAIYYSWSGTKWMYNASRIAAWVAASSAAILFFPVMFENERHQMEEQQLLQQRQLLLGPNVAGSGFSHGPFGGGMMTHIPPGGAPPAMTAPPPSH